MSDLSVLSTPVPEPPAAGQCDACGQDEDDLEPDQQISRCSVCKNRFFCSARCQKADWKKEHKFNCSPLNPAPVGVEYTFEQLEAEVLRITENLKLFLDALKEKKNDTPATKKALPAERLFIRDYEPPTELDYTLKPKDHDLYPYRHKLDILTRIVLLHQLSKMTLEQKTKLVRGFQSAQLPPDFCQLYGPKIVAYPGQLAPGEYGQLVGLMIPLSFSESSTEDDIIPRWAGLKRAQDMFYNVCKPASALPT